MNTLKSVHWNCESMNTLEYMNIPSCYVPRADGGVEADTRAYHHVTQGMLHTPPLPSPHIAAGLLFCSQTPRLSSPTQLGQDAVLPAGNRGRWRLTAVCYPLCLPSLSVSVFPRLTSSLPPHPNQYSSRNPTATPNHQCCPPNWFINCITNNNN